MGACASVFPKAMKGDAGEAPPAELPKEEEAAAAEVAATGEEKKVEGGEEKNKEGDESQSIGTILNEVKL